MLVSIDAFVKLTANNNNSFNSNYFNNFMHKLREYPGTTKLSILSWLPRATPSTVFSQWSLLTL